METVKNPSIQYYPLGQSRSDSGGRRIFTHTLLNFGNTCFFNSLLQLIASIPLFVDRIEREPLPPDHADSSYCLAFLKIFIPAIASLTSDSSSVLKISGVRDGDWSMNDEDWRDFVYRLAVRYDDRYVLGAFADPGDLLNYFLTIVPGVGCLCELNSKITTSFLCAGSTQRVMDKTVAEFGVTTCVDSGAPLSHHSDHILKLFQPERVVGYRCDRCRAQPMRECTVIRRRHLLSFPRFLRVNITAPLTATGCRRTVIGVDRCGNTSTWICHSWLHVL